MSKELFKLKVCQLKTNGFFRVFEIGADMGVDVPLHGNLEFCREKDVIKQHKRLLYFMNQALKFSNVSREWKKTRCDNELFREHDNVFQAYDEINSCFYYLKKDKTLQPCNTQNDFTTSND